MSAGCDSCICLTQGGNLLLGLSQKTFKKSHCNIDSTLLLCKVMPENKCSKHSKLSTWVRGVKVWQLDLDDIIPGAWAIWQPSMHLQLLWTCSNSCKFFQHSYEPRCHLKKEMFILTGSYFIYLHNIFHKHHLHHLQQLEETQPVLAGIMFHGQDSHTVRRAASVHTCGQLHVIRQETDGPLPKTRMQ